ncbi:MAG: ral secretion pathway protein GspJ [Deltaproteobacteria bacterium]|nr:ral secretion pathway protein GspJ [Deltaproteobacteria bacterium]
MGPPRRTGGFTLVEILLSLAILSVILVLLLSAFTGAARTREVLSARSREFRQVRIAMDRIGTDLQGAFSSAIRADSALTCKEDQLSGNPAATLVFTAFQLPETGGGRPPTSVVKIKYFPKVGADGASMELHREQSDLPFIENRIPLREALLAEGLKGFRVELYDGTAWHKEWPAAGGAGTTLPRKVAVTMVDSRGETYRREIPLVLAGQESVLTYSGRRGGSPQ